MAFHVDIIKTEPTSGAERPLARVTLHHDEVVIDSPDEGYWREALARAVGLDPDDQPREFFGALSERLDGTYVYATDPHDESECEHAAEAAELEHA